MFCFICLSIYHQVSETVDSLPCADSVYFKITFTHIPKGSEENHKILNDNQAPDLKITKLCETGDSFQVILVIFKFTSKKICAWFTVLRNLCIFNDVQTRSLVRKPYMHTPHELNSSRLCLKPQFLFRK
jgi:hypothetical protein